MYTLIKKTNLSPREYTMLWRPTVRQVKELVKSMASSPIAIDWETTGLDPFEEEIISVALANQHGCYAVDLRDYEVRSAMIKALMSVEVYGFNMAFDGVWLAVKNAELTGKYAHPNVVGDTMVLFKLLANEGYFQQSWSLSSLIENVLGWPDNSKDEFSEGLKKHGLNKADMWKMMALEPELFMKYNALDAEAAYQGAKYLSELAIEKGFDQVLTFHEKYFMAAYKSYFEQYYKGMTIDVPALEALEQKVLSKIEYWENKFKYHPDSRGYIESLDKDREAEHYKPTVSKKRVWAKKADEPWNNQAEWTRGDDVKSKLAKWEEEWGAWYKDITTVKPSTKKSKPKLFSLNSPPDVIGFFYTTNYVPYTTVREPNVSARKSWERCGVIEISTMPFLGKDSPIYDEDSEEERGTFGPVEGGHTVELEMTPPGKTGDGNLPTDKFAMAYYGDLGHIVKHYKLWKIRLNFINQLKAKVDKGSPILHPEMRMHGTVTSRASGGSSESAENSKKLNVQQLPKNPSWPDFYALFRSAPNTSICYLDYASAEDVIMAAYSEDKSYRELYASGKPHDGHLFFAMQLFEEGEDIAKVYYRGGDVTAENVAEAKKKFKALRSRTKPIRYGKAYKMGAKALRRNLQRNGVFLSQEEVDKIDKAYMKATEGVTQWGERLKAEWEARGGWFFDGWGLPTCCDHEKLKDLGSRFIQKTGHLLLLVQNYYVQKLREERNVPMRPWLYDLHDALLWEVEEGYEEQAKDIYREALRLANDELDSPIRIKGEPEIGDNWACFLD